MHVVSFFVNVSINIFRKFGLTSYLLKIKTQAIIKMQSTKLKYPNTNFFFYNLLKTKDTYDTYINPNGVKLKKYLNYYIYKNQNYAVKFN